MPFKKGQSGNLKGRPKGALNKVSQTIREMFQGAAEDLGGRARLVQWAKESVENERVFWQLATKLLPLQLTGANEGPLQIQRINRIIVEPAEPAAIAPPVIDVEPTVIHDGGKKHWAN